MAKARQKPRLVTSAPHAEQERSIWNQPLGVDFRSFFKALSKAAVDSFAGNRGDLFVDLVDAGTAIGLNVPPEQLAWRLVDRSLRRGVLDLLCEASDIFKTRDITPELVKKAEATIVRAMRDEVIQINPSFFDRPRSFPVVMRVQKALEQWLLALDFGIDVAEGLSSRLPSYFTFALNEEWRSCREQYVPLKGFLDTPFTKASEREQQWNYYNSWLHRQSDQRMFDEAFSIKHVYVRLRAAFSGHDLAKIPLQSEVAPKQQVVWLDDCLQQWIQEWDANDAIRVISGGPGAGKSAFARLFAAQVADSGRCRVVYIPLHLFELKADLTVALNKFCEEHEYLQMELLHPKEGEQKLLLIFDGLDELEIQGKMASQVASEFVAEVIRVVERTNQASARLMVLLCGRSVAVQVVGSILRRDEQIIHLLPYVVKSMQAKEKYFDPLNLLTTDQRDQWWAKYAKCVGKENKYTKLPDALNSEDFREITEQPLLNYLVALAFDRELLDFREAVNLSKVYERLINEVFRRRYERRPIKTVDGLNEHQFVRVLEEIGLASWHGDGRTATVSKIESRCVKSPQVKSMLTKFAGDAESGVSRLLTAFYFRQHGEVEGDKTFEFTHKSFGEYLTALRLIRELKLIDQQLVKQDTGDDAGFDEATSLLRWIDLCGPAEITNDIHRFLRQEIWRRSIDDVKSWQHTCIRLINYFLRKGMPMEKVTEISTFKEQDRQARNAEESLLATLNACSELTKKISDIDWPEPTSFSRLLSRLSPYRSSPTNRVAYNSLSYLNVSKQLTHLQDLYSARLSFGQMQHLDAFQVILNNADLRYTNLKNANLQGASLQNAKLFSSQLNGADLTAANLQGANLQRADLQGASLKRANLREASLSGADLTNCVWKGAILEGAVFEGIVVAGHVLEGASLKRAIRDKKVFEGASL